MRKNLILISSYLPNSKKEVFYKNEFTNIAPSFENVFLVYHIESTLEEVPKKFQSYYIKYLPSKLEVLLGFRFILNPILIKEIFCLIILRKFKLTRLIALIGSYSSSLKIAEKITNIINENDLKLTETSILSYWCNNDAVAIALLKKNYTSLNCTTRAHGYDVYEERNANNYLPLRKFIFDNLDHVVFISQDGYNYSREKFGTIDSFRTIYIGVHKAGSICEADQRESFLIVSCSNLVEVKRVDKIIDSLSTVRDKKIKWIHFGTGPLEAKLKKYSAKYLNPLPNINYEFRGEVTNNEILSFYGKNKVGCFINLSESEGIPVSIMEAMAHGIPVIASNVGGVPEIVENEWNGFLIDSIDYIFLEELIQKIRDNYNYFSINALTTVREKFDISVNCGKLIKLLKDELI